MVVTVTVLMEANITIRYVLSPEYMASNLEDIYILCSDL